MPRPPALATNHHDLTGEVIHDFLINDLASYANTAFPFVSPQAAASLPPYTLEYRLANPTVSTRTVGWINGGMNISGVRAQTTGAGSVTFQVRSVDSDGNIAQFFGASTFTAGSSPIFLALLDTGSSIGNKRAGKLGSGDRIEVVITAISGITTASEFILQVDAWRELPLGPVYAVGNKLYCNGQPWKLWGGTSLGQIGDVNSVIAMCALARHMYMNTIRVVGFIDSNPVAFASQDWSFIDRVIATAGALGMKVLVDMSTYYGVLTSHGTSNPFGAAAYSNWYQEFDGMATHVNPYTQIAMADDPTIAMISIAGEPNPPWFAGAVCTSAELTAFYTNVSAHAKTVFPNRLISTGGFLHLDDPGANYMVQAAGSSGIDWKAIFAAPGIDVAAYHIASWGDYKNAGRSNAAGVPDWVGAYCATVANAAGGTGKPSIDEEVDFDQANSQNTGGGFAAGDTGRAASYDALINDDLGAGASGVVFWNIGYGGGPNFNTTGSFDVSPHTPLTMAKVVQYAPSTKIPASE